MSRSDGVKARLVVALVLAAAGPAAGGPAPRLHAVPQRLEWSGRFESATSCPDMCAQTAFDVALPGGTWAGGGGVQVGVHWPDAAQDLNLWVYDGTGALLGFSARPDGDTESVLLPGLPDGRYRVLVGAAAATGVDYTVWVEVELALDAEPPRDLLPNLVPLPPLSVAVPVVDVTGSCYADEVAETGAGRCLRFDQTVANLGEGPLELHFQPGVPGAVAGRPVVQRVHRAGAPAYDRAAGKWEYHAVHRHFHVAAFAESRLWRSDPAGHRLDAAPLRVGRKNGFCLLDLYNLRWRDRGDGPRTFVTCQPLTALAEPDRGAVTGISAGWADRYGPQVSGQYVDIAGVPDGYYVLETVADPDGVLAESDETDNAVAVLLRLASDDVWLQ